jgi:DNA-binding beta-propeller fold protein YncE
VTVNLYEDTASIVDLAAGAETAVVPVGNQPAQLRITPDGLTAVVGNTASSDFSILDIASATEVRRIPGAGFAGSIGLSPEGGNVIYYRYDSFELVSNRRLVNADYASGQIKVFDVVTGLVNSFTVDVRPFLVEAARDGRTAVVSHSSTPKLAVVDGLTGSLVRTIDVGAPLGSGLSVDPTATTAVVDVLNYCRVVNLVTGTVSPSLFTGGVSQILSTADGAYALVASRAGSGLGGCFARRAARRDARGSLRRIHDRDEHERRRGLQGGRAADRSAPRRRSRAQGGH